MNLKFSERKHVILLFSNTNYWLVVLIQTIPLKFVKKSVFWLTTIRGLTAVKAQNEAIVLESSAETTDSIEFNMLAPQSTFKGNDALINYVALIKGQKKYIFGN